MIQSQFSEAERINPGVKTVIKRIIQSERGIEMTNIINLACNRQILVELGFKEPPCRLETSHPRAATQLTAKCDYVELNFKPLVVSIDTIYNY